MVITSGKEIRTVISIDSLLTNMFTICGGEGDSVKMNKPTNKYI